MYSFAPMDVHTAALIADTWKYLPPYDFLEMKSEAANPIVKCQTCTNAGQ